MSRGLAHPVVAGVLGIAALLAAGALLPKWLQFLATMAAANGIVSLGIVLLMRGGVVSFGQGLVFAGGGYAAALLARKLGVSDALLLTAAGGLVAALMALPFAALLARYRGIFFSMLTLALSMVLYGVLVKTESLGGSDGINMSRPTLLAWSSRACWPSSRASTSNPRAGWCRARSARTSCASSTWAPRPRG